jgi:hypothetical protein
MQIKISRSRRSPATEQPLAAVLGQLVGMGGCDLGLDGLCQQRSRAVAPPYLLTPLLTFVQPDALADSGVCQRRPSQL